MARAHLRPAASFLLVLNFCMYVAVLGLCGWAMNRTINYGSVGWEANAATPYFLLFSLIAGTVGAASCLFGLNHVRTWGSDSLSASASSATIGWSLTILAFGFACKHIKLHTDNDRLKAIEALIIILSATMLVYLVIIHGAVKK